MTTTKAVMRTICLLVLAVAFSLPAASQALFEDGHYIDLKGTKHTGLISINSITDTQPYLLFKTEYRSDPDTIAYSDVGEIRVSDFKFSRQNTRSLATGTTLDDSVFVQKSLLLKVELEGEATLYSKQSGAEYTFYFSVPGRSTSELFYSQYVRNDGRVARDNKFREQLAKSLTCGSPNLTSLKYEKEQLIRLFSAYNKCKQSEFRTYTGIPALSFKYLNIGLSVGTSPYFIESTNTVLDTENARFADATPYIEADIEYLIPSLNNRIGFFATGGYLNFSDSDQRTLLGASQNIRLEYQVIQSTIGVRGYWPVNNTFKLSAELGLGKDYEVGKGISIDYEADDSGYQDFTKTRLTGHLTGGIGIAFFNRYIIQGKFKHLNSQISSRSSDQRVKQSFFMIGFKYLLKSYYK